MAIDKIFDNASVDGIADNLFKSVSNSVSEVKAMQQRKAAENVQLVIQALKKIESDIQDKYDGVTTVIEKRVSSIKDGKDGRNGVDGKAGKDGRPGRDGATGPRGIDGLNGRNGVDGEDGVSVVDAHIDFDGSLIIGLSSGRAINVGEVVAPDLAEKIKVITNGGGTSQQVLDTLVSLQNQINAITTGITYQGTWNASTNTPTLTSSAGTTNGFYIVSVAGSTNLNGISNWGVGDWAIFNGTVWQRVEGGSSGNFVDLSVSGTTTLSGLTASTALALDASKNVVSVTNTGTGNNVLATSPTLVTPALGTPSSGVVTNLTGTASININGTVGATTPAAGTFSSLSDSGNLTFTGTGNRITGDFSNATVANRVTFQTSTTNGNTIVPFIPNGSATQTNLILYNSSDVTTNFSLFTIRHNATASSFASSIGGTGTYVPITFETGGSERMRLDTSGNMGIGTSSPGYKLSVTTTTGGGFNMTNGVDSTLRILLPTTGITYDNVNYGYHAWLVGGSEKMRIDSSGNVGIGTSSPIQKLDVNSNIFARPSTTAGSGELIAAASDYSSLPSFTNTALRQYGSTATGTFYGLTKASLGVLEFVNVSAGLIGTNGGTPIVFATTSTERMRIDSSGNVGIGASSPARKLDVRNTSADYQLHLGDSASTVLGYELGRENTGGLFKFYGNQTGATGYIFSGIDGERMRIDSSGNVLVTNPAGLGYGTGSGGTVTQATSRTTGVTLNKPTGAITLVSAAGSPTWQEFTVTNSIVTANDTFVLNQRAGADRYVLQVRSISAGSFVIAFQTTGGTTTEQPIFNFSIIKGSTS